VWDGRRARVEGTWGGCGGRGVTATGGVVVVVVVAVGAICGGVGAVLAPSPPDGRDAVMVVFPAGRTPGLPGRGPLGVAGGVGAQIGCLGFETSTSSAAVLGGLGGGAAPTDDAFTAATILLARRGSLPIFWGAHAPGTGG